MSHPDKSRVNNSGIKISKVPLLPAVRVKCSNLSSYFPSLIASLTNTHPLQIAPFVQVAGIYIFWLVVHPETSNTFLLLLPWFFPLKKKANIWIIF